MSDKTFFLGLGGQKCGSSWIQAYLNRQAGADFGRLGEYQIWEADLGSVFDRYKVPQPSALETLRAEAKRRLGLSEPAAYLRWRLQRDRSQYFGYFERLLAKPGVTMTGDITPSYAALPAPLLHKIKDGFEASGIATKAMFSMRDPVARIRSHYRMDLDKGIAPEPVDFETGLRAFYPSAEAAARTRYDMTLDAMETVFAPEDRFLCLFEELFTPEGVTALAGFAGVPVEAGAGSRKVNARGSAGGISDALTAEIARHYAPVYAAVARRLPQVLELWPSARFLTSA
ncbi:sulfotransferase family protein [Marinovum sp.]|uniref:sulfotransferase family protein n=1 Tax=Marinovum sp. TaxID=2024839 RepID=UPI002B2778C1|nr:sulfotransferase family protein [Marinovum sp.]